jgi:flagellar hook-length control protein FliK
MTNGISENVFSVSAQSAKKESSKECMQSDDFISTMEQIYSSDETCKDIPVQAEDEVLLKNIKNNKISEDDSEDYSSVFDNVLYMYVPVNQIVQADLSEISLNPDNVLSADEISINNVVADCNRIPYDSIAVQEGYEGMISDVQCENAGETAEPEKIVSESINPEKFTAETAESEKILSQSINPEKFTAETAESEKIISESINPEKFTAETVKPEKTASERIRIFEVSNQNVQNVQSGSNQNVADAGQYSDVTVNQNNIDMTEKEINSIIHTESKSETVSDKNNISDENNVSDFIQKNSDFADSAKILSRPVKNQQQKFNDSSSENNSGNASENAFMRENAIKSDFYKNINQVKEFIRNNTDEVDNPTKTDIAGLEKDIQEIDISQLQLSAMNNLKFIDISGIANKSDIQDSSIYDASEILKQTSDGIIENMHGNADKFTVMLNPEGLGKIEVTILKGDTSNILSLSVSDEKTAEILSSDISSLHKALSHLNVEVSEIRIENSQESSQYNGYEEQFERDNSNNQRRNHNGYNDLSESDEDDDFSEDNIYSESQVMSYI